jgi:hypothetical protein
MAEVYSEQKANMLCSFVVLFVEASMTVRSCKVTITDLEGVAHTVEVTASSLYEAVALGLASIRGNQWVRGIPDGFNPVKVRVTDVPVDHEVKLKDFTQWLERQGSTPKDITDRKRIRQILGLVKSATLS